MREDLINPSALKIFDQQFEIQFPLKNAQLKFHSKVITDFETETDFANRNCHRSTDRNTKK